MEEYSSHIIECDTLEELVDTASDLKKSLEHFTNNNKEYSFDIKLDMKEKFIIKARMYVASNKG